MEQAAEQRFLDGLALATTEPGHEGGAIYLLGYVAEMLVKIAYCHVINHPPGSAVFPAFQAAQSDGAWQGRNLHNLSSWVAFLVHTRTQSGNPLDPAVAGQIIAHVLTLDAHWREWLRYRATPATITASASKEFTEMISCLNAATIGGAPPLREYLALARKHGFGGVEFSINEAAGAGALFEEAGVAPASFGLPVEWRKDEAKFNEDMQALPDLARAAQALGCTRTCTWLPPAIQGDPIAFRNQTRTRFREVATVLGDHGIHFGLEWVGPYTLRHGPKAMGPHEFIWTMPGALELIADIDAPHDNVGLLVDSFHWFTTGATGADLAALPVEQIVHVHVNDAPDRPRDAQMDGERLLPGEGVIDLPAFLGALRQAGYAGPVAVETFSKALAALGPDEAARRAGAAMRAVIGG